MCSSADVFFFIIELARRLVANLLPMSLGITLLCTLQVTTFRVWNSRSTSHQLGHLSCVNRTCVDFVTLLGVTIKLTLRGKANKVRVKFISILVTSGEYKVIEIVGQIGGNFEKFGHSRSWNCIASWIRSGLKNVILCNYYSLYVYLLHYIILYLKTHGWRPSSEKTAPLKFLHTI